MIRKSFAPAYRYGAGLPRAGLGLVAGGAAVAAAAHIALNFGSVRTMAALAQGSRVALARAVLGRDARRSFGFALPGVCGAGLWRGS